MYRLFFISKWGDPTLWLLFAGVALAATSTAIIGTFNLLEKRSLVGDALGHAFLPGVCFAFLLTGAKSMWVLTLGCLGSGSCALLVLYMLSQERKIKRENAVALVLSIFLGVGLLLLSYIQHEKDGSQVGFQHFLLGSISFLMDEDILFFSMLNVSLVVVVSLLFSPWRLIMFDREFAKIIGQPIRSLQLIFYMLNLVGMVVGVQAVGIILMGALLISPSVAARFWTDQLERMLVLAVFFGIAGSFLGTGISYYIEHLPMGPCMALGVNTVAMLSALLAPKKGWLGRYLKRHFYYQKVMQENILKWMYEMKRKNRKAIEYDLAMIEKGLSRNNRRLKEAIKSLLQKRWLDKKKNGTFILTTEGEKKGYHIYRLHLLWEAYLEHHLHIQADHVHDDAESIEHMITPELEKELIKLVGGKIELH